VKKRKKRASQKLIIDVLYFLAELKNDDIYNMNSNREICNEGILLSDIFNCEIKGTGNSFLEQTIINYLAANLEKLETMHWRNFERFCAEYFQRLGYEVKLGPGSHDGGIDIKIYDSTDPTKPLILIQCKRNSRTNKVKIETVKAFYSDVLFENAKTGIIVTTSTIETGGKKISTARNYPLKFVENDDIKEWALNMWMKNY
jgi:restriction system protein